MANYVNHKELLEEMKISKERDELTARALELLQKMIERSHRIFSYRNPMDREDCMARAREDILRYWRGFDSEHPKSNIFSYFTTMIKRGSAKGMNELFPEIKAGVMIVPIDKEEGIYNI